MALHKKNYYGSSKEINWKRKKIKTKKWFCEEFERALKKK